MEVDFCPNTVDEALARYGRSEIFNTDQDSRFTSAAFTGLRLENAIRIMRDAMAYAGKIQRRVVCAWIGTPEFANEVRHPAEGLQCPKITPTSRSRTAARLPTFMKMGNRSAKSRQLWIARHRQFLAS